MFCGITNKILLFLAKKVTISPKLKVQNYFKINFFLQKKELILFLGATSTSIKSGFETRGDKKIKTTIIEK